jgi:hypothetical protein
MTILRQILNNVEYTQKFKNKYLNSILLIFFCINPSSVWVKRTSITYCGNVQNINQIYKLYIYLISFYIIQFKIKLYNKYIYINKKNNFKF